MDLKITGAKLSGDAEKDIKILANHVFQLEEQLRYQLRNLDVTNFNDLGLARYENGRMQVYAKEVSLQTDKLRVEFGKETDDIYTAISATAEELEAKIEANGDYTSLKATVDGLQTTVSSQAKTISSHTNSISSLQSQITQTSDKISAVVSAVDDSSGNVTAASIVAAINNAGSSVKISADHIQLEGEFVTISDLEGTGKVEINAGNIKAGGTISGLTLETEVDANHGQIYVHKNYIQFVGTSTDDSSIIENAWGTLAMRGTNIELSGEKINFRINGGYLNQGCWMFFDDGLVFIDNNGNPTKQILAQYI